MSVVLSILVSAAVLALLLLCYVLAIQNTAAGQGPVAEPDAHPASSGGKQMSEVEIHEAEEWSAVYLDGRLIRVGDSYLADEWVREHFGVVTVQDDAYLRGQTSAAGVAQTLDEVREYATQRSQRKANAETLRFQASELLAQAEKLEAQK